MWWSFCLSVTTPETSSKPSAPDQRLEASLYDVEAAVICYWEAL